MHVFVALGVTWRGAAVQQGTALSFVGQFRHGSLRYLSRQTNFLMVCGDLNCMAMWRHNFQCSKLSKRGQNQELPVIVKHDARCVMVKVGGRRENPKG